MKNLLKKFRSNSPFGGWGAFRMYILLLPLVGGWGATSCSLTEALKPTPQIDEYGLDKNAPFACLVNGKKWESSGKNPLFVVNPQATYSPRDNKSLSIGANRQADNVSENFGFYINPVKISKFTIGQTPEVAKEFWLTFIDEKKYPYGQTGKIPKAFTGYLNITKFDTVKYQTSGTFEFKTLDYKGDTIHITQGRFNINF